MLSLLTKMREAAAANGLTQWWPAEVTTARVARLAKEGFWVVAGQLLAVAGALVGVRVLTELLPPSVYGELALGMTAATLLNQVVFGPISNGASRFYSVAQEAGDIPTYLAAVKRLGLVATGWILTAAVPVAGLLFLTGYRRWLGLVLAALMFALLSGYNGILDAIQNGARQRVVVAWHQGLASWGRFLVAAGLVVLVGANSTTALVGYAIGAAVVLASQSWFLVRSVRVFGGRRPMEGATVASWRTQIMTYSWPFAAWGWLTWAQQASDRWALGLFATTEQVGQYAVLYQLGYYPMMLASGMILQLIGPMVFQRAGAGLDRSRLSASTELTRRLALWTAIATLGVAAVFAGTHQTVFALLVGEQYRSVSGLLPWMALAGGLFAAGQALSLEFMTAFNTRALVTPKLLTAIFGVALNLIGAALAGLAGVVAASALWSLAYLAVLLGYLECAESRITEE